MMFAIGSDRSSKPCVVVVALAVVFWASVSLADEDDASSDHVQMISTNDRFVHATPVSVEFTSSVEAAAASIPNSVWQRLDKADWRIELAEFLTDAVPHIRDNHPRGWPEWMTWENVDGVNLPGERRLVFPEKMRNRDGDEISCTRVAGVIRHEVGHAFDMVMRGKYRFYSSSPAFQNAYRWDVRRMSLRTREELSYYLQKSTAGRQETFAEAFAIALGGGSDANKQTEFKQAFRLVLKQVDKAIGTPAVSNSATASKEATSESEDKKAAEAKQTPRRYRRFGRRRR